MKQSIAWHEECLKNEKLSLQRQIELVERETRTEERYRKDVEKYEAQIARAKKLKKDGFDSEKFGVI
jgi:hypothetical protein